jgi:hypothetical protein
MKMYFDDTLVIPICPGRYSAIVRSLRGSLPIASGPAMGAAKDERRGFVFMEA